MKSEDDGAHREELAAFLATAPEHLKPWADEQLAELATGDDGPGESAAEPEFSDERARQDGDESPDDGAGTSAGDDDESGGGRRGPACGR